MSEKTITEEEVIMNTLYKYHLNIGTPIGLIQEFLITLINEDKENIIEKKYIFLKKHYLDLYQEHIQDYRYEGIGMAEKFLLNYILPLRNNQHLLSKEIEEQLSIMDTTLWTNTIQEYLKSDAHSIFTLAITGSKEYKEATINEDLIPENIKAITNKTYLDYNFDQKNTEALQLQINQDFDYEMTAYIRSVYQSMFQEISDLFINFLQQKIKEADLNYKKTII